MNEEKPTLDDAYCAGKTIDTTARLGGSTFAVREAAFAAVVMAEIDLDCLKDNEHWRAAGAGERHYLDLVLVCECGKRHRLRFGPGER